MSLPVVSSSHVGTRPAYPMAPRHAAPAPQDEEPSPPAADIDFSTVDTPQKAVLLPALTATVFELLVNTTAIAGTSGVTSFSGALHMAMGASTKGCMVHSDTAPDTYTLNGSGHMGSAPITETWSFNDQGLSIEGTIGSSQESLLLTEGDDGLHLDGSIGSVEVHQLITSVGSDIDQKIIWDGTVGGEKFHQERSYVDEGRGLVHDHVEGALGDAVIRYDQHWTQEEGDHIAFATAGQIAGVPLQSTHAFEFNYPPGR